jgi:hypothetical protein
MTAFCINCGTELSADTRFCTKCGTENPAPAAAPKKDRRWLWWVVADTAEAGMAAADPEAIYHLPTAATAKTPKPMREICSKAGKARSIPKATISLVEALMTAHVKP